MISMDITLDEDLVPLSDVPMRLPRMNGRRVHEATIYSWAQRGLRGVKLETLRIGGRHVTSKQALERFFRRLVRRPDLGDVRNPPRRASSRACRRADEYGL